MDPDKQIKFQFFSVVRVYKSGRIELALPPRNRPCISRPSDPLALVTSKDIVIDSSTGLWVRLYLPQLSKLVSEHYMYPSTSGLDDPASNPFAASAPNVHNLVCKRVLVCLAEHDLLRHGGVWYCEKLKESGWDGETELLESVGEGHAFHVMKPTSSSSSS